MENYFIRCEDTFSSPLLKERNKRLGRNFLYTVLVFAVLCAISYILGK